MIVWPLPVGAEPHIAYWDKDVGEYILVYHRRMNPANRSHGDVITTLRGKEHTPSQLYNHLYDHPGYGICYGYSWGGDIYRWDDGMMIDSVVEPDNVENDARDGFFEARRRFDNKWRKWQIYRYRALSGDSCVVMTGAVAKDQLVFLVGPTEAKPHVEGKKRIKRDEVVIYRRNGVITRYKTDFNPLGVVLDEHETTFLAYGKHGAVVMDIDV